MLLTATAKQEYHYEDSYEYGGTYMYMYLVTQGLKHADRFYFTLDTLCSIPNKKVDSFTCSKIQKYIVC